MVKLASNAFLATKISFINEIANVCEETGADVVEVARGMGLDNRIGPKFLQAGIGFGGSCFPKDVTALKQLAGNSGYHFQLLNSVIEVNELQKRRVIAKLEKHLGRLVDKQIALLGLAFKPNTDDMREASSLVLSSRLQAAGAHVRAYDPVAEGEARKLIRGVRFAESAAEAVEGADAVVLVTEWPEFAELDLAALAAAMRGDLLVDGRNLYDPAAVRAAGLVYEGIGRAAGRADAGADPRRGRGNAAAAADVDGAQAGRPAGRPAVHRVHARLAARRTASTTSSCPAGIWPTACATCSATARRSGVRLRYLEEPRPLGTGGALKFAEDLLDERFLMLNGDVLTDIDVTAQIARARGDGRAATLALYPVEDPRAYGLVRLADDVGERVRREAGAGPDRHQQHLRGRVRAREVGAVAAGARASGPRSSATSSRGWSATASTATCDGLLEGHRDA